MNKLEGINAFPLHWPQGWKREIIRTKSRFKMVSFGGIRNDIISELRRMGANDVIFSTNIPLKKDGLPYATYAQIKDVGVAVYFIYKNKPMVFACDKWQTIEENASSIKNTIEAIRGIERWGASEMMERAFTGFQALPAPEQEETKKWWEVLGISQISSPSVIKEARNRLAKLNHPDWPGGTEDKMQKINQAYEEGMSAWK